MYIFLQLGGDVTKEMLLRKVDKTLEVRICDEHLVIEFSTFAYRWVDLRTLVLVVC
jgi:hypothetical protein